MMLKWSRLDYRWVYGLKAMRVYFGQKELDLDLITLDGSEIACVAEVKLLVLIINNQLTWNNHVDYICGKASCRIYFLCLLWRAAKPSNDIVAIFCSIIWLVLEYSCEVWHSGLTKQQSATVEQKQALLMAYPDLGHKEALNVDELTTKEYCRQLFEKMQDTTHKLHHLLPPEKTDKHLRHKMKYELPKVRTDRFKDSSINYCLFHLQAT